MKKLMENQSSISFSYFHMLCHICVNSPLELAIQLAGRQFNALSFTEAFARWEARLYSRFTIGTPVFIHVSRYGCSSLIANGIKHIAADKHSQSGSKS